VPLTRTRFPTAAAAGGALPVKTKTPSEVFLLEIETGGPDAGDDPLELDLETDQRRGRAAPLHVVDFHDGDVVVEDRAEALAIHELGADEVNDLGGEGLVELGRGVAVDGDVEEVAQLPLGNRLGGECVLVVVA